MEISGEYGAFRRKRSFQEKTEFLREMDISRDYASRCTGPRIPYSINFSLSRPLSHLKPYPTPQAYCSNLDGQSISPTPQESESRSHSIVKKLGHPIRPKKTVQTLKICRAHNEPRASPKADFQLFWR